LKVVTNIIYVFFRGGFALTGKLFGRKKEGDYSTRNLI